MFVYFAPFSFSEVPTFQEETKTLFGNLMDEGVYFSFSPCSSTVIVLIPVFPAGFLTVSVLIPFVVLATG